jgi:hypothetical protein
MMHQYEIRIFRDRADSVSLMMTRSYFSNFAAIRAAQTMCGPGEICQVWRDDVCLFDDRSSPVMPIQSRLPREADARVIRRA